MLYVLNCDCTELLTGLNFGCSLWLRLQCWKLPRLIWWKRFTARTFSGPDYQTVKSIEDPICHCCQKDSFGPLKVQILEIFGDPRQNLGTFGHLATGRFQHWVVKMVGIVVFLLEAEKCVFDILLPDYVELVISAVECKFWIPSHSQLAEARYRYDFSGDIAFGYFNFCQTSRISSVL